MCISGVWFLQYSSTFTVWSICGNVFIIHKMHRKKRIELLFDYVRSNLFTSYKVENLRNRQHSSHLRHMQSQGKYKFNDFGREHYERILNEIFSNVNLLMWMKCSTQRKFEMYSFHGATFWSVWVNHSPKMKLSKMWFSEWIRHEIELWFSDKNNELELKPHWKLVENVCYCKSAWFAAQMEFQISGKSAVTRLPTTERTEVRSKPRSDRVQENKRQNEW